MNTTMDLKALILDSLGETVFYVNSDLRVKWSSEYASKLVGAPGTDLVGTLCYELWCQRRRPCPECPTSKAMETARMQRGEVNRLATRVE